MAAGGTLQQEGNMTALKNILVPTDFGDQAERALELALELARHFEAQLTLLHVVSFPAMAYANDAYWPSEAFDRALEQVKLRAQQRLDALCARVKARHPRTEAVLLSGHPSDRVVEVAALRKADLVVMGTHGRRGLPRMLLGSVAEKVVRLCPVPVLIVPEAEDGAPAAPAAG
jgi:nucleotide-binding universal stress UspA family protein